MYALLWVPIQCLNPPMYPLNWNIGMYLCLALDLPHKLPEKLLSAAAMEEEEVYEVHYQPFLLYFNQPSLKSTIVVTPALLQSILSLYHTSYIPNSPL